MFAPVLLLLAACTGAQGSSPGAPSSAAQVALDAAVGAAAVASESPAAAPSPAGSVGGGVAAGTVALAPGPFLDRVRLTALHLGPTAVTGTLDVTSDVSEIITLEVSVAFYDGAGTLLGSSSQLFSTADTEPFHTTSGVVGLPLTVPVPAQVTAGSPRSAVLGIPVLVNE